MAGPIKPSEVEDLKLDSIPEEVFEAFNEMIVKDYYNGEATVKQNEVVTLAALKLSKREEFLHSKIEDIRNKIYAEHWADVETSYRKSGWTVTYDMPSYCESYSAYYVFKKNK